MANTVGRCTQIVLLLALVLQCVALVACANAGETSRQSVLLYGDGPQVRCRDVRATGTTQLATFGKGRSIEGLALLDSTRLLVGVSGGSSQREILLLDFSHRQVTKLADGVQPAALADAGLVVFSARSPSGRGLAVFRASLEQQGDSQDAELLDDGQYASPRLIFPIDSKRVVYKRSRDDMVVVDVETASARILTLPSCVLVAARPRPPELLCMSTDGPGMALRPMNGNKSVAVSEDTAGFVFWSPNLQELGVLRGRLQYGQGEIFDVVLHNPLTNRSVMLVENLPLQPGSAAMADLAGGCASLGTIVTQQDLVD